MVSKRILFFLAVIAATAAANPLPPFEPARPEKPLRLCTAHKQWVALAEQHADWVEITETPGISVQLPYATFDNITGHDLYCGIHRAFLHRDAAQKMQNAVKKLQQQRPGYSFLIYDAGRPRHAQEYLRAAVRGTPYSHFVSSPVPGSIHSYGMAIDLTLLDAEAKPLDMGVLFDSFESHAGSQGEAAALRNGLLTQQQIDNRLLLRRIMREAGFTNLPSEWWHFNAGSSAWVRENYRQLN